MCFDYASRQTLKTKEQANDKHGQCMLAATVRYRHEVAE